MTREQFIDLVKKEQESLRRFLLALCAGDYTEADDIAQDSLIRAYVSSNSLLDLSKFRSWLFKIAYHCYVDHCRKTKMGKMAIESDEAQGILAQESSEDTFKFQQLYDALNRLPERERVAIILHYFEGRNIKEVSFILEIPVGTVKSHLFSGRSHLRLYYNR